MQELLEKIFKPLLDYQKRQTIYEENITKKKEIVRIRCQLNSKVTGSKEGWAAALQTQTAFSHIERKDAA